MSEDFLLNTVKNSMCKEHNHTTFEKKIRNILINKNACWNTCHGECRERIENDKETEYDDESEKKLIETVRNSLCCSMYNSHTESELIIKELLSHIRVNLDKYKYKEDNQIKKIITL